MTASNLSAGHAGPNEPEPTLRLADQRVEQYRRDGFIAIERFIDEADVARLQELYDQLFETVRVSAADRLDLVATDDGATATIPQIMYPSKYIPQLLQTQAVANARAIFRQLLGEDAVMSFDHAISKPPHNGAETPWHQDEAYWEPELEYRSLSIWIALQPVTIANGCMSFIPRAHHSGVVPHRHIGNDPAVHGLEIVPGAADVSNPVACPLPTGGATVHGAQTLHYTGGNTTDTTRRAYIIAGATPAHPRPQPRTFPWRT